MKIAEINTVHYGSTGKIMLQIAQTARGHGHEVKTFSKFWKQNPKAEEHCYIGNIWENMLHRIAAPLVATEGAFSVFSTRKLIRQLKVFAPDVIHLHNLHGWYLNYGMLFQYIKEKQIRVIWTLHDCWAFTGQCPHFTLAKCNKWKTGCHSCPQYRSYPGMCFDRTKAMWQKKKGWFTGVKNLTVVTPSQWLADLAKESFLREYPIRVIHNGIDLSVFRPAESDFREKCQCEGKYILLGVAFGWGQRKGLDVFTEMAQRLGEQYQIVLVGTSSDIDKLLPDNIISIHRTNDQRELAQIYSAADLFVNPTREENYPTVNMEAIACGTPVLTFRTGGSPEIVDDKTGSVVDCDDVDALLTEIRRICENRPFTQEDCLEKANKFNMNGRTKEYIDLYENCSHSPKRSL